MTDPRAKPLADSDLSKRLLKLVKDCVATKQIKKGANEATKALNRSLAELIIIAADTTPLELILHLTLICEDKVRELFITYRMFNSVSSNPRPNLDKPVEPPEMLLP